MLRVVFRWKTILAVWLYVNAVINARRGLNADQSFDSAEFTLSKRNESNRTSLPMTAFGLSLQVKPPRSEIDDAVMTLQKFAAEEAGDGTFGLEQAGADELTQIDHADAVVLDVDRADR